MGALDGLSAARRAQYESLLPDVRRSAQTASNARGGFYSGAAVDAETRAEADLLAKLAGQDAADEAHKKESDRNDQTVRDIHDEDIRAGKRNSLVNLLGAGVGSAATLGGLTYMNKGASGLQFLPDGKGGMLSYNPSTKVFAPVSVGGGAAPGVGGAALGSTAPTGLAALNAPGPTAMSVGTPGAYVGAAAPAAATAAAAPVATSMWNSPLKAAGGVLGGAAAGYGGSKLAELIAGRGGKNNDLGAAAGGLAGFGAGAYFGGGNPWLAGLGALGGSLGGGLLGNLFR